MNYYNPPLYYNFPDAYYTRGRYYCSGTVSKPKETSKKLGRSDEYLPPYKRKQEKPQI